tara:strand:+ start:69 stop:539 length:471 start_codon:yes stop_codon:yes gene_type:complete
MIELYIIIILSLLISYSPYIKKILLKTFKLDEIIFLEHLFFTIPLLLYVIYVLFFNKNKFKFLNKVTKTHVCYICAIIISSIIAGILYYFLINNFPISKVVPVLSPLIIIFSVLIGICLFKEKLNKNEIFGILLILLGIYVTKSKNVKIFLDGLFL